MRVSRPLVYLSFACLLFAAVAVHAQEEAQEGSSVVAIHIHDAGHQHYEDAASSGAATAAVEPSTAAPTGGLEMSSAAPTGAFDTSSTGGIPKCVPKPSCYDAKKRLLATELGVRVAITAIVSGDAASRHSNLVLLAASFSFLAQAQVHVSSSCGPVSVECYPAQQVLAVAGEAEVRAVIALESALRNGNHAEMEQAIHAMSLSISSLTAARIDESFACHTKPLECYTCEVAGKQLAVSQATLAPSINALVAELANGTNTHARTTALSVYVLSVILEAEAQVMVDQFCTVRCPTAISSSGAATGAFDSGAATGISQSSTGHTDKPDSPSSSAAPTGGFVDSPSSSTGKDYYSYGSDANAAQLQQGDSVDGNVNAAYSHQQGDIFAAMAVCVMLMLMGIGNVGH